MTEEEQSVRALAQLMGVEIAYWTSADYPVQLSSKDLKLQSGYPNLKHIKNQFHSVVHAGWAEALECLQSAIK